MACTARSNAGRRADPASNSSRSPARTSTTDAEAVRRREGMGKAGNTHRRSVSRQRELGTTNSTPPSTIITSAVTFCSLAAAAPAITWSSRKIAAGTGAHQAVAPAFQHSDSSHPAHPLLVAHDVHHRLQTSGDLGVHPVPVQPGRHGQRLQSSRHIGGAVRVHRSTAALMTGVEGCQ